jgi:xanthine/CO dehydrogenase XdhC/CoxF family maturation factor
MTSETLRTLHALVEASDAGRPVVLATIVRTRGSTPRKEGARMVVAADGSVIAGTVGGGCGEGEVLEVARDVLTDRRPRTVRVDLTEELVSLSLRCAGASWTSGSSTSTPVPTAPVRP